MIFLIKYVYFAGFLKKAVLYDSMFNKFLRIFKNWLNVVNTASSGGFEWQNTRKFLKDGKRVVGRPVFRGDT